MRRSPLGASSRSSRDQRAIVVEQLLGTIALHPVFQNLQMFRIGAHIRNRDLMRAKRAFNLAIPSTTFGPVQPLGVSITIIGHCGRFENPFSRASF